MTEATKHDGGKVPLDLLDAEALEGLAAVLAFGAKKYTQYGACNCQSIKKNIGRKTESVLMNGDAIILKTIPNIVKNEQGLLLNGITTSQIVNLTNCFQSQNVKFAVQTPNSILIMTTPLDESVVGFVEDVILHSAKWNGENGWTVHEPTCNAHKEMRNGAHNWRGGISYSRLLAALLRHSFAILRGERIDPESGLPHIDHVGCCWMFLSNQMKTRPDMDDLYKKEG